MSEQSQNPHTHSGAFVGLHSHDGGPPHWHDEFGEHLAEELSPEEFAAREIDWKMHNLQVVTIGMDVGSSTSHIMFSRINLQLVGEAPNVRSVVVGRELLWQSDIIFTPYRADNTIDVEVLRRFVADAYASAGATLNDIDAGAVILTGEALKRENARAIAELFAEETGKFVCASAGHHLEAVLAANGSGTVARSRRDGRTLLNVDIGGGTTKLALVREGEILGTAAIAIGARQVVRDHEGRLTRVDEPAARLARQLGIGLESGGTLSEQDEAKIVSAWVAMLADLVAGRPPQGIAAELMLTDPLPAGVSPQAITFSGGVSEFLFMREAGDFGDLGKPLAMALRRALSNGDIKLPALMDPNMGIRATAVGASLFTTQVGVNLHLSDEAILPLRNVPVLSPHLQLEGEIDAAEVAAAIKAAAQLVDFEQGSGPVAVALGVLDALSPPMVQALARGVSLGLDGTISARKPFVVLIDETIGSDLGAALRDDAGVTSDYLVLEGISVPEFAYIDVAEVVQPARVVPVNVKSLLFAGGLDKRSVKQALISAQLGRR